MVEVCYAGLDLVENVSGVVPLLLVLAVFLLCEGGVRVLGLFCLCDVRAGCWNGIGAVALARAVRHDDEFMESLFVVFFCHCFFFVLGVDLGFLFLVFSCHLLLICV